MNNTTNNTGKNTIRTPSGTRHGVGSCGGRPRSDGKSVKIIPLGGLEQIGMNITAFEYGDSIIVVDCGMAFPDEDTPGVDQIIPDTSYLKKNAGKIKGFFITHAHEDHIGAVPYVLNEIKAPLYGTKLTVAIIDNKLDQHRMRSSVKTCVARYGQVVEVGDFSVEFIRTNHSIPDAAALAIRTPAGTIIHTGDFKIDYSPVSGTPIDLERLAEIGNEGVLAMLCDSTNAAKPGTTASERSVGAKLDLLFDRYRKHRIFVATFASNVDRVQQILNAAYRTGKKVAVDGRSMVIITRIATALGYINIPQDTLIDLENINSYRPEDTAIIMTGSQGEETASLTRISTGKHMKIHAVPGDVVIISSHPIPGNEKPVSRTINRLVENGIEVVDEDVHVSGHAGRDDIRLLYSVVRPEFSIPVHGDFVQRRAQAGAAASLGYDAEHIVFMKSGDVLELSHGHAEITGRVQAGCVMVDGGRTGTTGGTVITERKQLSTDGTVIVTLAMMEHNNTVIAGPEITCRGFVCLRESRKLINDMYITVDAAVKKCLCRKSGTTTAEIKEKIRTELGDMLWSELRAKPIIIPVIMEV